jgi:XrtJ-associated TM-motif-TM protein
MKKSPLMFLGFALLLFAVHPLHAQTGCTVSPENPTAILAVVGSAGAFLASARARIKARRHPTNKSV